MVSKEKKNCWDFWNCEDKVRKNCAAYTSDSGRECWMVVGNSGNNACPKLNGTFKNCLECPWFSKLNPDF